MEDKLEKTWSLHVRPGQPFWRIRRLWWKALYGFYRWNDWDPRDLDPDWLRDKRKERPP